ncbi:MAG: flavin monoamine oxidase family protein [Rhodothermales bacterium]
MHIVIMGAGLSGLTVAYLLGKAGVATTILESRTRVGGRVWTKTIAGDTPVEAGATWFGMQHTNLIALLDELDLEHFPQHTAGISLFETMSFVPPQRFNIPPSDPPSYRISGGSSTLIRALVEKLPAASIKLGDAVASLDFQASICEVATRGGKQYTADVVISTLPPRVFAHNIDVKPALPEAWMQIARETHTWMADSMKFFVSYAAPFWKEQAFSGAAFSQSGIIPEMYDHTSSDGQQYALKGFLAGHAAKLSHAQRKEAVLAQLVAFLGERAKDILQYDDVVWSTDPYTRVPLVDQLFPHQNNGHEMLRMPLLDGRLHMGGSETADVFPGYMDGAVHAAQRVAKAVVK